ncbi:hypothetical protein C0993_004675 [Termitomyces sp. T159_Od127]|nr:hypothetical protein C0993_004675 [Termitomyces sp. T159_Od127]
MIIVLPSATSDVPRPAQPLNESSGGIAALVRWKSIAAHLDADFIAQQIMVRPRFKVAHLNADLVARQMTCPFGAGSVFCPDGKRGSNT